MVTEVKALLDDLGLAAGLAAGGDFGVGIDVEPVARWEHPAPALFTAAEHAHCRAMGRPAESYAGRWCAKEAVFKALAPFVAASLRDIEILVAADGRPLPVLRSGSQRWRGELRLSIAHSDTVAVALAVAVPAATRQEHT
jgi:fatty acid synthase subunit alpha